MKEALEKGTIGDVFGRGCSQMKRYQEGIIRDKFERIENNPTHKT